MDFDWKKAVSTVAPAIGSALGTPLVGSAIAVLLQALGISSTGEHKQDEAAIAKAMTGATPNDLLKLKQADDQFTESMAKLGIDILNIESKDRDSARQREAAIRDSTTKVLAYLIVGTFLVVSIGMVSGLAKVDSVMAGTVIGYLSAKAEQVASYYFGSSSGSEMKTRLMSLMQRNPKSA